MKRSPLLCSAVVCAILLTGCAAGGVDRRMASAPRTTVQVNGYPIYVAVVSTDPNGDFYDVEAGDDRMIGFTGLNEPLVAQARFRSAAVSEMERQFGQQKKVVIVSELSPTGFQKLFLRFALTPK